VGVGWERRQSQRGRGAFLPEYCADIFLSHTVIVMLSSHFVSTARLATRQAGSTSRCLATASTSQSSISQPSTSTSHYRITLRRSAIGLPDKIKGSLASLGLKKRLQSVYLPQRGDIAGMILAVKELVHVENVKRLSESTAKGEADIWLNEKGEVVDWGGRQARKAPRGYTVVGNVSNAIRNEEILALKDGETLS
jgi:large subunit ribosomal protein L30